MTWFALWPVRRDGGGWLWLCRVEVARAEYLRWNEDLGCIWRMYYRRAARENISHDPLDGN